MQDLSIDIKTMPQAFGGYHLLLVIFCDQTNFTIAVPLRDRTAQTVAEALIYRVIYLFGPLQTPIMQRSFLLLLKAQKCSSSGSLLGSYVHQTLFNSI